MQPSIIGRHKLPESLGDFEALVAAGQVRYASCVSCGQDFSFSNTHSARGWKETQITAECEDCFDSLFEGDES